MLTKEAIVTRRSSRVFSEKSVPHNLIEELIDAARQAPTARNVQPWEFIVVTDPDKRKAIAEICDYGKFIKDAGACIVVVAKNTKYYLEDGSAATENILLAATELGLGSCWVAGDKKPYADKILKFLGVPEGYRLISSVSIGYPAGEPTTPAKRLLKEVIHWERF